MFLTKDDFEASTPPYEDVPTPELKPGSKQRVKCLSALEKDKWDAGFWTVGVDGKPRYSAIGARARLLFLACVKEDFTPTFTDPKDVALLERFRSDVADRLYDAAERVSGLKKDLEELKKAFGAAQAGASATS